MKNAIIFLFVVLLCFAACSKKKTPAPDSGTTANGDSTSISKPNDTSQHSVVTTYYNGSAHYRESHIDSTFNPKESDTSFADSAIVITTINGTDTTVELRFHTSPPPFKFWATVSFKKLHYELSTRYSHESYTVHGDTLSFERSSGVYLVGSVYTFIGKK